MLAKPLAVTSAHRYYITYTFWLCVSLWVNCRVDCRATITQSAIVARIIYDFRAQIQGTGSRSKVLSIIIYFMVLSEYKLRCWQRGTSPAPVYPLRLCLHQMYQTIIHQTNSTKWWTNSIKSTVLTLCSHIRTIRIIYDTCIDKMNQIQQYKN